MPALDGPRAGRSHASVRRGYAPARVAAAVQAPQSIRERIWSLDTTALKAVRGDFDGLPSAPPAQVAEQALQAAGRR